MFVLPAAAVSIGSYVAAPLLLRRCRPMRTPVVCPLNWFFLLFAVQLVVTPVVVTIGGPACGQLPHPPSVLAVNLALLLYTLAFWCFCVGVHIVRRPGRVVASSTVRHADDTWTPPNWMVALYFFLGVVGLFAFFHNPATLLLYFLNPQEYLTTLEEGSGTASLADVASTFLRAFFPFSILLLWCKATLSRVWGASVWSAVLLCLVAISSPIYSYERSSLVVPVVAILAVFCKRGTRQSRWAVLGLVSMMMLLLVTITAIRLNPDLPGANQGPDGMEQYQAYGMSPQYLGFLLEGTHYGRHLELGASTVGSVLSPVPLLGKAFREGSGLGIYSQLLQRTDQPSPFVGELFLDGHAFAVVAGFLAVGWLVARLQDAFETAREPLHIFILMFATLWSGYMIVSSISVTSQMAIYLSWPVYLFLLYRAVRRKRRRLAVPQVDTDGTMRARQSTTPLREQTGLV